MNPGMSFEQAPPLHVPLRFFITAAIFGIAAGLLLSLQGSGLITRWSGTSLAATHLMTTGFMLQVMLGALFQLTPVAIGIVIWHPRAVATWVHSCATLGGILLPAAFLHGGSTLYLIAGTLLALATLPFCGLLLVLLIQTSATGEMLNAMRAAGVALAITVLFGLVLAASRAGILPPDWLLWTNLHIRFGWLGWGLLLLSGVSYQVVPMFQLTPPYPALFRKGFLPGMLILLLMAALSVKWLPLKPYVMALESCAVILFAGITLDIQRRRRRRRTDTSFHFWRAALGSMLLAALIQFASLFLVLPPALEVNLGVLVLLGAFASVMIGMLYKIVPFLIWLHLQRRGLKPLLMNQVINEKAMTIHLTIHILALLLCLATPWYPLLAPVTGSMVSLSFAILLFNILQGVVRYHRGLQHGTILKTQTTPTA